MQISDSDFGTRFWGYKVIIGLGKFLISYNYAVWRGLLTYRINDFRTGKHLVGGIFEQKDVKTVSYPVMMEGGKLQDQFLLTNKTQGIIEE